MMCVVTEVSGMDNLNPDGFERGVAAGWNRVVISASFPVCRMFSMNPLSMMEAAYALIYIAVWASQFKNLGAKSCIPSIMPKFHCPFGTLQ